MKNLYKAALLAALGLGSLTVAHAAVNNGDLLLGFTDSSIMGGSDYVIDLGTASALIAAANANNGVVNLTTGAGFSQSTFNSVFSADGNALNNVSASVVGGKNVSTPFEVWGTVTRGSTPSTPVGATGINGVVSIMSSFSGSVNAAGASATIPQGSTPSFTTSIAASATTAGTGGGTGNDYTDKTTQNPATQLSSGMAAEDLYTITKVGTTGNSGWGSLLGWFTFDVGNSDAVEFHTFTAAVPEPATYGALAGAGLLALSLRRQFTRKNA